MLKIAIVEDEIKEQELIRSYLIRYAHENSLQYTVKYYSDPLDFLDDYRADVDVVLLDIELPNINGMKCAKKLREMDSKVKIVFITNMRQFAINGYEVEASDFIVKPVSYFKFATRFQNIRRKVEINDADTLLIKSNGVLCRIASRDVYYIEVSKHDIIFHTADGEITVKGTLKKTEEMLNTEFFFRCSNFCVINLRYITHIKEYTVTITVGPDGETKTLSIGRAKKSELVRALNNYLLKNI